MQHYTEREDRQFISQFVRSDHPVPLTSHQAEEIVNMATTIYRYGRRQVSDAVSLARDIVINKSRIGRF